MGSLNETYMYSETRARPMEEIFKGQFEESVKCKACKDEHILHHIDNPGMGDFHGIQLPISQKIGESGGITLEDCFREEYKNPEAQDKDYICGNCDKKETTTKMSEILEAPKVLIVSLKRFRFFIGGVSEKIKTRVEIPQKGLNLRPYMKNTGDENPVLYDLYALIRHHGASPTSGHYTTYGRVDNTLGGWRFFNDSTVHTEKIDSEAEENAYILFYVRRENPASKI